MLGNIVWICPLAPGTSADVLIWDGYDLSCTCDDFFDFEVGGHDGACEGSNPVIVPFMGRKNGTLTAQQKCYNELHGWYHARIQQLFACLWNWGLVRNIWCGSRDELHQSVRILLHFSRFGIGGRSATLLMDHGTTFRLMFGRTRVTGPQRKMSERMSQK